MASAMRERLEGIDAKKEEVAEPPELELVGAHEADGEAGQL